MGDKSAVCLQEAPLNAIAENLLYEEQLREKTGCKVRYRDFGIRFNKAWIFKRGGRPVVYEQKDKMKAILSKEEYWRIVNFDLDDANHMIDWTHEREWRVKGDLVFEYKNIEILVPSSEYYKKFVEYCIENDMVDVLKQINGIVVLNTIFY